MNCRPGFPRGIFLFSSSLKSLITTINALLSRSSLNYGRKGWRGSRLGSAFLTFPFWTSMFPKSRQADNMSHRCPIRPRVRVSPWITVVLIGLYLILAWMAY